MVVRWAVPKPLVPTAAHDPLPRSLPASTRPSGGPGMRRLRQALCSANEPGSDVRSFVWGPGSVCFRPCRGSHVLPMRWPIVRFATLPSLPECGRHVAGPSAVNWGSVREAHPNRIPARIRTPAPRIACRPPGHRWHRHQWRDNSVLRDRSALGRRCFRTCREPGLPMPACDEEG